jgi:putative SOS response-associated peptidase YedK
MISARTETVAKGPTSGAGVRDRRGLVQADGFYEWKKGATAKVPRRISRRVGRPCAPGGLWERWRPPAGGGTAYRARTCMATRRSRGPSNSQKKTPCQRPSTSRPPLTSTASDGPKKLVLRWLSLFPSACR